MEKAYKYSLQKGKKYICPQCGKKTFVRYIDNVTGVCCPEQYGRCDREIKCGYIQYPKSEFVPYQDYKPLPTPKPQPKINIPIEVFESTLTDYDKNVFIQNLLGRVTFPIEACDIEAVIAQYYLGTVASFGGAVAFPYIDIQNNIRAIQVKQFDQANHTTKTTFIHYINDNNKSVWFNSYNNQDLKISCLFGEHLLTKYPLNPVALVEAPKSAIYGTLYFGLPTQHDRLLWLAVYNLSSLNVEKCKSLKGREVFLFPDLSTDGKAFNLWSEKAKELNIKIQGAKFIVSDLLEREASEAERAKGCDIADYLICQDWRLFRGSVKSEESEVENKDFICSPQPIKELTSEVIEPEHENFIFPFDIENELTSVKSEESESQTKDFICSPQNNERVFKQIPTKENWTYQILELESYFAAVELPASPLRLNNYSVIIDLPLFIESHLSTVKANNGRPTYKPYLNRLHELKQCFLNN